MDKLKRLEKSGQLSEDDAKLWSTEIQDITDNLITKITEAHEDKEREILQV